MEIGDILDLVPSDCPLILSVPQSWSIPFQRLNRSLSLADGAERQDTPSGTELCSSDYESFFAFRHEPNPWYRMEYRAGKRSFRGESRYWEVSTSKLVNRGYVIGTHEDAYFHLPEKSGCSSIQCRIYLNQNRTWMICDESSNGTKVNGEVIASARVWNLNPKADRPPLEIALHPQRINTVLVGKVLVKVWVAHGRGDMFPTGSAESLVVYHGPDAFDTGLFSRPSTATGVIRIATDVPEEVSKYHVLEEQTISSDYTSVIDKTTGKAFLALVYRGLAAVRAAEKMYKTLSTAMKHDNIFGFITDDLIAFGPNTYMIIVPKNDRIIPLQNLLQVSNGFEAESFDVDSYEVLAIHPIRALKHLHSHNMILRNIGLESVLWQEYPETALLTCFDECRQGTTARGQAGDIRFRAPEMKARQSYDSKVDVYTLCAMLKHLRSELKLNVGPEIVNTLETGLVHDPVHRSFAREILDTIETLKTEDLGPEFRTFSCIKQFKIRCFRNLDGTYLARLSDLAYIISTCLDPKTSKAECELRLGKESDFPPFYIL